MKLFESEFSFRSPLHSVASVCYLRVEQAYRWIGGYAIEQFEGEHMPAADSWIISSFTEPVKWEVLRECISGVATEHAERNVRRMLAAGGG